MTLQLNQKEGGNFVENAQSSFRLLLEEGTSGYVMPVFTGRESKVVAYIKIDDFSEHCRSQAKSRNTSQTYREILENRAHTVGPDVEQQ